MPVLLTNEVIMGPLGIQEFIFTVGLLVFFAGMVAGVVFVVFTIHQVRRETALLRSLLIEVRTRLDELIRNRP